MKIFCLVSVLILTVLGVLLYAQQSSAPVPDLFFKDIEAVKSVTLEECIFFEKEDFDRSAGTHLKSITVLSLPDSGRLMLGEHEVSEGQIISRSAFDGIKYIFDKKNDKASFGYGFVSSGKSYTAEYVLYRLSEYNFPPVFSCVSDFSVVASGCSHHAVVPVSDPEGDELSISVLSYPQNGVLTLLSNGKTYRYTANSGYVGDDGFSIAARDKYGNQSGEYRVTLKVIDAGDRDYFDMRGSAAQSSAAVLEKMNIMSGYTLGGISYFEPDAVISKEEFVAAALSAAGIEPAKFDGVTAFADEDEISPPYEDFVGYAHDMGWLDGEITGAVNYFKPKEGITYGCALDLVYEIIGTRPRIPLDIDPLAYLTNEGAALILQCIFSKTVS